jgi:hypothetical protein
MCRRHEGQGDRVEHVFGNTTGATARGKGDHEAQWAYLRGEVGRQLAAFQRRRRRDKRKAFALQLATVTLSAAVTVLVGLRTTDATRTWLLNVALVLGALTTVVAGSELFFGHRRLWALRTATVRRLETLARHVEFHMAGRIEPADDARLLAAYLSELDAILADDQKGWQHLRESPPTAHEGQLPHPAEPSRQEPRTTENGGQ